ncbi:hypothetical protein LPB138_14350 [Urechidicola croceus]|uniref:Calx-beta domain-containing protein n=1 Tax=Urechidicola croceus TaxID=1850246 RepID=A0A1D8PB54_9FLAO|nr:hypothetical protein LPB138_14350 [Urechidicola croceus]
MSCDEDKTTYDALEYPSDAFISLSGTTTSVPESSTTPIEIVATYSNSLADFTSDVSVDFTISSDIAIEGTHYTVVDGKSSFNFPVGVFTDKIEIIPIDNITEDGDKVLAITLENSTVNLGFPGPDSLGKTLEIILADDDCAKNEDLRPYEGSWTGDDNCGGYTGVTLNTYLPCLEDGAGLTFTGLGYNWLQDPSYWAETITAEYPTFMTVDLDAGTVEIAEQAFVTTLYDGDYTEYNIFGSGTIDTSGSSPVITIQYDMTNVQNPQWGPMSQTGGTPCSGVFEATFTLD